MKKWKDIRDFEDYWEVSIEGLVRCKVTGEMKKIDFPRDTQRHYPRFKIGTKNFVVHRLLMETFKPVKNMGMLQVDHLNEDKQDFRLENLEWVTPQENQKRSWASGRRDSAKLTPAKVKSLRACKNIKEAELKAEEYGVSISTIRGAYYRVTWKSI